MRLGLLGKSACHLLAAAAGGLSWGLELSRGKMINLDPELIAGRQFLVPQINIMRHSQSSNNHVVG